MQPTSTETLSVSFPALYEHIRISWESIQAEHRKDNDYLSYINVGLQELSFYDKYKGDDLPARFRESCLEQRGIVDLIADKTLPVAGARAEIRTVKSPEGYFYYFGVLPISSRFCYTFIGDCESVSREFYEPLFDGIFESLQYFGNPAEAWKKQQEAIEALFSKYQTDTTTSATEEKKEVESFAVPEDGREHWQIGDHTFVLTAQPELSISDGDGALYVRIDGLAPDDIDQEQSDLINDYEDRKVYLQFYFKGIYNAGIPTGRFSFEKEKENTYLSYLWKGGFHYLQELSAEVTLENGWLGINGYFNEYPVRLAVKLPTDQLDWTKYRFLSEQEVDTAKPDIVHQLWLKDPYPGLIHETLQPLTHLRILSIDFPGESTQAADFKEVPVAVKRFGELTELSLTGVAALDSLPKWLGDLKKLETIRLSGSKVEGIHPYILQLPVLKNLYLSGNQLGSIHQALPPQLDTLVLSDNQLSSVPESVLQLKYLNIERNPLKHLPAGLDKIPRLYLELEKKRSLLDYTYKGADGLGTVAYDDQRFYAKHDPELLKVLETGIDDSGLSSFKEGLVNRSRKSVALATTTEDDYSEKGNHRFGGLPDLPAGVNYPSFTDADGNEQGLQFIAQINCAAVAHLQDYLPRKGILYFFIKDQEEMGPQVWYHDVDDKDLQSAAALDIDPDFIYDDNGIYTPFRAESGKYASIPGLYNAGSLYPELSELEELYDETEELESRLKRHSVDPVHTMNSYVFKQHDTPEMEAVNDKKGNPDEWTVLLRVSSDRNTGFNFWDAGEIYFVIHKSDLEKKDFSNVYCGLESS